MINERTARQTLIGAFGEVVPRARCRTVDVLVLVPALGSVREITTQTFIDKFDARGDGLVIP